MPDEKQQLPPEEETVEVDVQKDMQGKVKWFGNPMNPTPSKLKNFLVGMRYGFTGASFLVLGAPHRVITAEDATVLAWWFSAGTLATGVLQLCVGVEPSK